MGVSEDIKTEHSIQMFETREAWAEAATRRISKILGAALETNGQAVMALSGGSTPVPIYDQLSKEMLDWSSVRVEIVDDRVTTDPNGLNSVMIDKTLRQNQAKPFQSGLFNAHSLVADTALNLAVMGMGTDGHTASWFPGSTGLKEAMDPDMKNVVASVQADGCPGAGNYPLRTTMTLPAIMKSDHVILLLTGQEKLKVFESAFTKSVYDAPVKALLAAGPRLTVMWAP